MAPEGKATTYDSLRASYFMPDRASQEIQRDEVDINKDNEFSEFGFGLSVLLEAF